VQLLRENDAEAKSHRGFGLGGTAVVAIGRLGTSVERNHQRRIWGEARQDELLCTQIFRI